MAHDGITITGWREGWLGRTSPAFEKYFSIISIGTSLAVCALTITNVVVVRRHMKSCIDTPSGRATAEKEINKLSIKITRGHWL